MGGGGSKRKTDFKVGVFPLEQSIPFSSHQNKEDRCLFRKWLSFKAKKIMDIWTDYLRAF